MKPKKFLNDPADAVDEYVAGLLLQYPTRLRKLAGHHVVLSSAFACARDAASHPNGASVSLLSGGGSGHEPSHAGFVGTNMLSGAILGGIFASPSVASILAAIRAVTLPKAAGGKGCLLIVKNYTGDRLNFGMALELAAGEGYDAKMVVVADDCAVERKKGITGARGVAGTVLVHKAAGGAAGEGASLDEVTKVAETIANSVGSLGVALDTVTIPGAAAVNDRLDGTSATGEPMMEVGLGIHGEAGMRQCPLMSCDDIAKEMLAAIQVYGKEVDGKILPRYEKGDELLVLVNNLGGASNFEMSLLARSLVTRLEGTYGCQASQVLVGSYMTSFDMRGASVSVLPLKGRARDLLPLFDANTDAPGWASVDVWTGGTSRPSNTEIDEVPGASGSAAVASSLPPLLLDNFADKARAAIEQACTALIEAEPLLTKYDTIVGDGDCGITQMRGAKEISTRLDSGALDLTHPVPLFSNLADAISSSMGGTSGVLLELMFRRAGASLASSSKIASKEMAAAFRAGVEAVSFYGGAREGSRTMLDALFPASEALTSTEEVGAAAAAARKGADATAKMELAEAGRSNYLSKEALRGTPDPGAVAAAVVLEALAKAIS